MILTRFGARYRLLALRRCQACSEDRLAVDGDGRWMCACCGAVHLDPGSLP